MKKHQLSVGCLLILAVLFTTNTHAQFADCDPDSPKERYRSRDFFAGAPIILTDVPYGTKNEHKIDIYLPPVGDADTNRPVALWAHGGGFITGSKTDDASVLWCTEMAKMGYVAVSLEYQQEMLNTIAGSLLIIGSEGGAIRGVYRAIQDARSAIRYLKANASMYGIDATKIFFAGSSAGGILATSVAYMAENERPTATKRNTFLLPDLGCIDCGADASVDDSTFDGDIIAGVGLWSAVEDFEDGDGILDVIDDATDADGDGETDTERMLFLHGIDDQTVLADVGTPFQTLGGLSGALLPDLYGTLPIRQRLASLGADAPQWEAHVLCVEEHGFHIDEQDGDNGDFGTGVPDENFDYVFNEATDHFYHALDPSLPQTGDLQTIVEDASFEALDNCDNTSKGTYAPTAYSTYRVENPNSSSSYCWDITKGTILSGQGTPEITVRWSDAPNAAGAANINDAVERSGTVLCYESTMSGGTQTIYKASQLFTLINDGPTTAPAANFTQTAGAGVGQIDFTDASTNANHPTDTYEWDFGDGTSSIGTDATPSHNYTMVGTYTVKLTAMNQCGNRSDFETTVNVDGVTVAPKVYLQGPFNGADMNTDLDAASLLPTNEPYTALGFASLQNAGTGFAASFVTGAGGDVTTDWVLVELRDMTNPSSVVAARAALLQKDGDVVDIDNASAVGFIGVAPGMYHIVVRHRNHLGVMTGMPVSLN